MKPSILVTGDVVLDHNIYAGQRLTPDAAATCGMRHIAVPGGAMLTYGLLDELRRSSLTGSSEQAAGALDLAFGLREMTEEALRPWPGQFKMGAVWEQSQDKGKNPTVWCLATNLGYGSRVNKEKQKDPYPGTPADGLARMRPSVIAIDDGGLGFRFETARNCWPQVLSDGPGADGTQWVILKMSSPLGRGDLWWLLAEKWYKQLVIIVAADDIRRENVRVTGGLSWESTVDDLLEEVDSNPLIARLKACRHLVVTLQGDAALWLGDPGSAGRRCRLVFDRERGEGEWDDSVKGRKAFGYLSAVTAAVAWNLRDVKTDVDCDLEPALKAGLSAARLLREEGHGPVKSPGEPGFPFERAAAEIKTPGHKYSSTDVSCLTGACSGGAGAPAPQWTILLQNAHTEAFPGPLFGPARRVALFGPTALEAVPCARFGQLLTMDRREIDALRSLRQLMLAYKKAGPQKRPLSLAVFGAPGSGKSFGLEQIAEGVFGDRKENPILTFNLSQFKGPEDLIGAYHQVRDHVLAGKTPVVFWDEFDCSEYRWLPYLLAPMQDGAFQEGQLTHSIGKCVFVFAGGTTRDYENFGPPLDPRQGDTEDVRKARAAFIAVKGPDFKSRLSGYLNVLGPNPRQRYNDDKARQGGDPWEDDVNDVAYPVRRAMLIRSMLGLASTEKENEPLDIDPGLLTALLKIGHYRHGARSLEKLIQQMRDKGGHPLRRAYLPCDDLVSLYVDGAARFTELTRSWYKFWAQAEDLAPHIHKDWFDNLSDEERAKPGSHARKYEDLNSEGKERNIAAAMRMPEILELAGLELERGSASEEEQQPVQDLLETHLETLAEAEHVGWMDQTLTEGWTRGEDEDKNFVIREHPLMVPYAQLPDKEKNKDRRTIRRYPDYAREAGFKIVFQASAPSPRKD